MSGGETPGLSNISNLFTVIEHYIYHILLTLSMFTTVYTTCTCHVVAIIECTHGSDQLQPPSGAL